MNSPPVLISLKTGNYITHPFLQFSKCSNCSVYMIEWFIIKKCKYNFKKGKKYYTQITGGSITTHKPRVYKPSHMASATDMNTKKKFAFLSTETVPDYRPMEYNEITEKSQKTSSNQSTKFHQLQQKFNNVALQVRIIYACMKLVWVLYVLFIS